MASDVRCREIMKSAALGESARANQLYEELDESGRESYNIFVIATFATVMGVRFESDQSLEAVRTFSAEMAYDYRDAEPAVTATTVELVLRAMMGEEELFAEIPAEELQRIQLYSIRKVVDQTPQVRERLDEYLTEAEALAQTWV
ncbi:hypothetical protein LX16_5344 [Stackebrandtia albiflava]|uniref:Uncharacterized protein n=2 Tax=Stackebrandtia albiflava TaxID=406432 RepID=A0A562UL98_9ACTN|nr:hypothetical protein LX16_5344 [Stackebrandtia albiflava]